MRSRLGMFACYKKKEGGGQDLSPCPGGSGTNTLTYLLTSRKPTVSYNDRYHLGRSILELRRPCGEPLSLLL